MFFEVSNMKLKVPKNTDWRYQIKYPEEIRKIIYTTNVIEEFHRQLRKVSKTKGAFTNETALLKLIYLAIKNIEKKWTMPPRNWGQTVLQLSVFFEGRLKLDLRV